MTLNESYTSRLLLADLYLKLAADFQDGNPHAGEIKTKTRVFLEGIIVYRAENVNMGKCNCEQYQQHPYHLVAKGLRFFISVLGEFLFLSSIMIVCVRHCW